MIIDELPPITLPIEDTDELPLERGQYTYKAKAKDVTGAVAKAIADNFLKFISNSLKQFFDII